jgi:hypothetical protein
MPSCAQVHCPKNSSSVPAPPGSATKTVGKIGHHRLAFMHGLGDVKLAQAGVPELALDQRPRDHADDASAGGERRIGHRAHQADLAAAIDDGEPGLRQRLSGGDSGFEIERIESGARAAENANGFHAIRLAVFPVRVQFTIDVANDALGIEPRPLRLYARKLARCARNRSVLLSRQCNIFAFALSSAQSWQDRQQRIRGIETERATQWHRRVPSARFWIS